MFIYSDMSNKVLLYFLSNILLLPIQCVHGDRASTWDFCGCEWGSWKEWSVCDEECGGSTSRIRSVWHYKKPQCTEWTDCASHDMGQELKQCNKFCENGGRYTGFTFWPCICKNGWTGRCCTEDMRPPEVADCSDDMYEVTSELTKDVSWKVPTFSDPKGATVHVTSNYPDNKYRFPWGDFRIEYVAVRQSNGVGAVCSFIIRVRPNQCLPLPVPANGAVVCNNWRKDFGQFCFIACRENYTIGDAFSYKQWYVCGASGSWFPSSQPPNCTESGQDSIQEGDQSFQYKGCNDLLSVVNLKKHYVKSLIKSRFGYFCTGQQNKCMDLHLDDIAVLCN